MTPGDSHPVFDEATLGTLSQLPPELRLMIWDFLLFECEERTPISLLSVMQCSRFLNDEIYPRIWKQTTHINLLRSPVTASEPFCF